MLRISEIWRTRLFFIGLLLLSLVPIFLQQMLSAREIYEIRYVGGLHPIDLQTLRFTGQLSFVFPAVFICALLASFHPNPAPARMLLAISVTAFLIYLILFLCWAVLVIQLRVPVL